MRWSRTVRARPVCACGLFLLTVWGCVGPSSAPDSTDAPSNPGDPTLAAYLETRAREDGFSGAVRVTRGDSLLLRVAHGLADAELGVALEPDHVMRIGSLTKPITAVAALRLAERGELDLDESICAYVPSCPASWCGARLTHLMTHTSGIPDLFEDVECAPVEETADEIEATLARAADSIDSSPGESFDYNNFGYVLLAYAMERASGRLWEEILRREVFAPLGMDRTGYDDVWALVRGRARGYELVDGRRANIEYDDHCAYSAGGLRSTADDLHTFLAAVHDGSLLSEPSREAAFRPVGDDFHGYGWEVGRHFGRRVHTHTGGIDGFSSAFAFYPDEGLSVVVLSNLQEENAAGTACDLAALALAAEWVPMSQIDSTPLEPADAGDLVGTYTGESGVSIEISSAEGYLRYSRNGGRGRRLLRVDADTLALERAEQLRLRFARDGRGDVTHLTVVRCGEEELQARRG
jgi:CubicO group peptidase (beta-lactamase class C family)